MLPPPMSADWENPHGTPQNLRFDDAILEAVKKRDDDAVIDFEKLPEAAYAMLTSPQKMPDGTKQALLDFGPWNYTHSKYMLGVYSHIIVLVVGYIASLFFKAPEKCESVSK